MPINNYFMHKIDKTSMFIRIYSYIFVSSKIHQNIASEVLNASCNSYPWTCVRYFFITAKSNDITNIFVMSILIQKIAYTSIYDIIMFPEHFEIKKKDLPPL